jgi:hypothetical protein
MLFTHHYHVIRSDAWGTRQVGTGCASGRLILLRILIKTEEYFRTGVDKISNLFVISLYDQRAQQSSLQ